MLQFYINYINNIWKEMVASNSIASIITIIISTMWNYNIPVIYGDLRTISNSFINDDSSFGSTPSSGDANQDLIYFDVRYRVLGNATNNYLNELAQKNIGVMGNTIGYVSSSGTRSLCNTLFVPFVIYKNSNNPFQEILRLKYFISQELNSVKVKFNYMGPAFIQALENHINWLMLILDTVHDTPTASVSNAYSVPNWGPTSTAASNACILTMNNLK